MEKKELPNVQVPKISDLSTQEYTFYIMNLSTAKKYNTCVCILYFWSSDKARGQMCLS